MTQSNELLVKIDKILEIFQISVRKYFLQFWRLDTNELNSDVLNQKLICIQLVVQKEGKIFLVDKILLKFWPFIAKCDSGLYLGIKSLLSEKTNGKNSAQNISETLN